MKAVPKTKVEDVMRLVKTIHSQESRGSSEAKALFAVQRPREMKFNKAAIIEKGTSETLSYYSFPPQHWKHIKTNNLLERVNKEIRRRTRVVGSFPDSQSALMLVAARLRHIMSSKWGSIRYMNMQLLFDAEKIMNQ